MAIRTKKETEALYRALLLPRIIEEKKLRLIRQGRLSKWFSGFGQEAIAVGVTFALSQEDLCSSNASKSRCLDNARRRLGKTVLSIDGTRRRLYQG